VSIREKARQLFAEGVDGVLAFKRTDGVCIPHLFTKTEVEEICKDVPADQRYPVAGIVRRIFLSGLAGKIGVVARGCDERALIELGKQGQIDFDLLSIIGVACSEEQARYCECSKPYPSRIDVGSRFEGISVSEKVRAVESMEGDERLAYWLAQFASCLKCMGCRNICPVCYCVECSLEDENLVRRGSVPPDWPVFHLLRAVDMASRCIDCGLCEESCPSGIPLRTLYKKATEIVKELFDYEPGADMTQRSPLGTIGDQSELPGGAFEA